MVVKRKQHERWVRVGRIPARKPPLWIPPRVGSQCYVHIYFHSEPVYNYVSILRDRTFASVAEDFVYMCVWCLYISWALLASPMK